MKLVRVSRFGAALKRNCECGLDDGTHYEDCEEIEGHHFCDGYSLTVRFYRERRWGPEEKGNTWLILAIAMSQRQL